jgi:hypothetical protein
MRRLMHGAPPQATNLLATPQDHVDRVARDMHGPRTMRRIVTRSGGRLAASTLALATPRSLGQVESKLRCHLD